jgi:hypothetical protein
LDVLVGPLLRSQPVQRLRKLTFLGILSPRFRQLPSCPLWPRVVVPIPDDGSRFDHSIGVALTALDIAQQLGLSLRAQRYAATWGLVHDIATWPLSHTSEPAFTAVTGLTSRRLRESMLLDREDVPPPHHLAAILREMDLDPVTLVDLFSRVPVRDQDLALFQQVIRSPLTPDTLEGAWRSGLVFGVPVPAPEEVRLALTRRDQQVCLTRQGLPLVLEFWNRKADVYQRFINREDVVLWESAWTLALQRDFAGLTLPQSLEISEAELVVKVQRTGLPPPQGVVRYKEPQEYYVNGDLDALPPEMPVSDLWRVLRREPAGGPRA